MIKFCYHPPKSTMWGHRLGKMRAERARSLFEQFLATAVSEYRFISASLNIYDASGQIVSRYERLVGTGAREGRFEELTQVQCTKCLDEIVKDESSSSSGLSPFLLAQSLEVTKWRIGNEAVATSSLISMYYGRLPCISTFLLFDTVEQFQHVKRALGDLRFCKLSEKHLKPINVQQE